MENVHLSLWDILFLPISLPIKSIGWTLAYLQDEAEKEDGGQEGMWASLLELEVLRDIGKVSENEYQERRQKLLAAGNETSKIELTGDTEDDE